MANRKRSCSCHRSAGSVAPVGHTAPTHCRTGRGWHDYRVRELGSAMRYFKGTIALSQTQDLPLLRQVMYSKYVTQTQLWQFMRHSGYELSRGSFWWRVKRLEDHGFITRHSLPMAHRDPIFAIASPGLVYLVENVGMPYNGPVAGPDIRVDGVGVAHALGVNEVHLDLLRSRALVSWENEMEIRCRNELADTKYAKDYDAIVTLALGGRQLLFALEYERTPKAQTEYDRIVSLLERERNLDRVLYLAGTRHIRSLLKQRLWRIRQRVLIGLASDLPKTEPTDLEVVDAQTMQVYRLVDIP